MLLRQLKLQNIRSYSSQLILFPEGTTVLSGDIGSGKSTILLAVEFALFGSSRPDLPAELLLRKGAAQGSVELTFSLGAKTITIQRGLKKDKQGIKQLPGSLTINGIRKELMPVELKAEIISLLGYPEDLAGKNKNYIFRYTVYTPQEEMKLILQEKPEERLDVLRRIFNIDKYKLIRENTQLYMKQLRLRLALLEGKTEPLEQCKVRLSDVEKELRLMEEKEGKQKNVLFIVQERRKDSEQQVKAHEQQQKEYLAVLRERTMLEAMEAEKQATQKMLDATLRSLQAGVPALPPCTQETVREELSLLGQQRKEYLFSKAGKEERLSQTRRMIEEKQQAIARREEELHTIADKETLLFSLQKEASSQSELQVKQQQLEELFQKTSRLITKNETILLQAEEMHQVIAGMEQCPTCRQIVSLEHKNQIRHEEEKKITQARTLLFEMNKKKSLIFQQQEEVRGRLNALMVQQNHLIRLSIELEQLRRKGEEQKQERELLIHLEEEEKAIAVILQKLESGYNEQELRAREETLRRWEETFSQIVSVQQHIRETSEEIARQTLALGEIQERLQKCRILSLTDQTECIETLRRKTTLLSAEEKDEAVRLAEYSMALASFRKQREELSRQHEELSVLRTQFLTVRDFHAWLETFFLKITYTIEKHLMISIHHHFNQLFQEWFSVLVEDGAMQARLDEEFTPVMESNGYEIAFDSLSGGEKTSAALAYRLALNRVINDVIHLIKTKDLLILDEPTDGFSSEQLDKVRDVLERLNVRQTIIVSHESKVESFVSSVIRIQKNGVSKVLTG